MMIRDVDRLARQTYDLLVVGGGIYGLTIACDAAQRGLSVALIERDDFGSGSTFNHLRTIHGGLRYLQTLDIARARESIRERRTLARIAPHAVQPQLFALPLYRSVGKGKLAMRAGFVVDRLLGIDRNSGIGSGLELPPGRVTSRGEAVDRFPGLRRRGLTGAATWHDYITLEPDRLTFAWALAAARHGAAIANHVEALTPLADRRRVVGVRARDRMAGREIEIGAAVTVNATGAAIDRLLAPLGLTARIPLLKAMNLVTRRDAGGEALGGKTGSGRHLFLVPWRHRALFGTWESGQPAAGTDCGVSEAEVAAFIAELNEAFPSLDLTLADVSLVHRGLVPAAVKTNGAVALERHEQVRDHSAEGMGGMLSVAGTKYTTARAVAERVTTRILAALGRRPVPCRTAATPLPGGQIANIGEAVASARREYDSLLPPDTIPHLIAAYGTGYEDVLRLAANRPDWRRRLATGVPVVGAELVWAARHEMAMTLADATIRRTPLGALEHPGEPALRHAADIVGAELGWSEERKRQEIGAVDRFYGTSNALNT
jgi:glycerol-3-phosphate dehydrogenase